MEAENDATETPKDLSRDELTSGDVKRIAELKEIVEQRKEELQTVALASLPPAGQPFQVYEAIRLAKVAREKCAVARARVGKAYELFVEVKSQWKEIQTRQNFLLSLQSLLHAVRRLHSMAQTISDAKGRGAHAVMAEACVQFESLNGSSHDRMDERFACLRSISEKVSMGVALSMRLLRASLRACCRKFNTADYAKCMMDFYDLGAISDFPSHVMQVFEEEGTRLFDDAMALDARPSEKIISFFSAESNLLAQFIGVLRFHANVSDGEEGPRAKKIRLLLTTHFEDRAPPFRHFSELSVRIISLLKFSLLAEPTTALLQVFEAATSFCHLTVVAGSIRRDQLNDIEFGFRKAPRNRLASEASQRAVVGHSLKLRRGGSTSNVGGEKDSSQRKRSTRRAWSEEFHQPILISIKELAGDCLSARHARHAEELKVITETPESWIRVSLSSNDVKSIFQELFHGIHGRISSDEGGHGCVVGVLAKDHVVVALEELSSGSFTFTTASLAMLRWISEYATVGVTVEDAFPNALRDITDIFLILLYASVGMKSRSDLFASEPFLKFVEDLLLERPPEKSIETFISNGFVEPFRLFLARYGEDQRGESGDEFIDRTSERWGVERPLQLTRYTLAEGNFFSTHFVSEESILRQCVAAEGIGTLCDLLLKFLVYLTERVRPRSDVFAKAGAKRLASLRSAIALAEEVRKAFYKLLAWDIVGGWEAVSAVAETCRSFHEHTGARKDELASEASAFVSEMLSRVSSAFCPHAMPPAAAEHMSAVICEAAMDAVLEGFSRVRYCTHTAAASQILVDLRTLDLALVELTGLHPCPGRQRTEMYVKATFLDEREIRDWIDKHARKLTLSGYHVQALIEGSSRPEIPVVEQIITP